MKDNYIFKLAETVQRESVTYKNRYGYISVDLDTQKKTIKKSGRWIKEVTENNGF